MIVSPPLVVTRALLPLFASFSFALSFHSLAAAIALCTPLRAPMTLFSPCPSLPFHHHFSPCTVNWPFVHSTPAIPSYGLHNRPLAVLLLALGLSSRCRIHSPRHGLPEYAERWGWLVDYAWAFKPRMHEKEWCEEYSVSHFLTSTVIYNVRLFRPIFCPEGLYIHEIVHVITLNSFNTQYMQ